MPVLITIMLKQTARTGMVALAFLLVLPPQWASAENTVETAASQAEPPQAAVPTQSSAPAYSTVQENLKAMDQDGDGQVSVLELRAYLEARHGKGYEQKVMDDLASSAKGKSCATPFAQSFY